MHHPQQEVICAGSVGGALLAAAAGNATTPADASSELLSQLAADLLAGRPFNLTDAASLAAQLERAAGKLGGAAPPAGFKAAAEAAAGTVALVNSLLEQALVSARESKMASGADKMVQVLARLARVCQVRIGAARKKI